MIWRIGIDTGGTFTDGVGISPEGSKHQLKVLSNGSLRGRIVSKIKKNQLQIDSNLNSYLELFEGYRFNILGQNKSARITGFDDSQNTITIDEELSYLPGELFELTANEEAPILLVRLMTKTLLSSPLPPMEIKIGTTRGTNALLERSGAKVLLIVTKGFKDLTKIGTQARPDLFQLNIPAPILFFNDVLEAKERILANGSIQIPLDEKTIQNICAKVRLQNPEAIAISFCNSYKNDFHESALAFAIRREFNIPLSVSSELEPGIKYLYRTRTTIIDAYLNPIITAFIQNIQSKAPYAEISMMKSDGGLVSGAHFKAKDSLLSGPAGGLIGAKLIALKYGIQKLISFDMGGTSTDVGRIDKSKDLSFINSIGGVELLLPLLSIETVAAGGGSICSIKEGVLETGPESAGAYPGPAAYGAGGPLTITDVNFLLGRLSDIRMRVPLNSSESIRAFNNILDSLDLIPGSKEALEILQGFIKIAVDKMAASIQKISLKKGFDSREHTLIGFGGAGGLHTCQLAEILNIKKILIPYSAGILSAGGILHSKKEKLVQKQVLASWALMESIIQQIVDDMINEGVELLIQQGICEENISVAETRMYLRLKGQENAIELFYTKELEVEKAFFQSYEKIFGYIPSTFDLELESIRVIVSENEEALEIDGFPEFENYREADFEQVAFADPQFKYKGYFWDQFITGDKIDGPALIVNDHASVFLEHGWSMHSSKWKDLLLKKNAQTKTEQKFLQDAINLELFQNRFQSIAEGMGTQLQRTAMSINIRERLDFSCAILNHEAQLIVNAPHIPVHLGCLGYCARMILNSYPIERGDIILTNHPAFGGSHLPDLTLIAPVYSAKAQLIAYVLNRAHHAEIGGILAGSMAPTAKNLEEEGVVIKPFYIVRKGKYQLKELRELLSTAKYPSRRINENIADLQAAIASIKYGQEELADLVEKKGLDRVRHYMNCILDRSEKILSYIISEHKGLDTTIEEFLDDGHKINLKTKVDNTSIYFDFSGSASVHPGNLNANLSIIYSAIMYLLRLLTNEDIPLNDGLMRRVEIILPVSFLSPSFDQDPSKCPAVAGGNTEVSQRVVDSLIKTFGLAACSQGTMNNFLFGNEKYSYYETIGGGVGAGPGFHGRSGIHQHMTNTRITDPEDLEQRFPVLLKEFSIRENSGGRGKWNGGNGLIRKMQFLESMDITILSQHRKESPYGLFEGEGGQTGKQLIKRKNGQIEELKGNDQAKVNNGDSIYIFTPGGGGYGKEKIISNE